MDAAQFNAAFDAVDVSGGYGDQVKPPIGWCGELTIPDTKLATKDGEQYAVVEYRSADGKYEWSDFKYLTKNGYPHDGRIKSMKILLASLGYPQVTGAALPGILGSLVGKRFTAEVVGSGSYNTNTGEEYVNTKILGAVPESAGASPQEAAAQAQPAPQAQSFPAAETVPWDQPAQVAPPANAIAGA